MLCPHPPTHLAIVYWKFLLTSCTQNVLNMELVIVFVLVVIVYIVIVVIWRGVVIIDTSHLREALRKKYGIRDATQKKMGVH